MPSSPTHGCGHEFGNEPPTLSALDRLEQEITKPVEGLLEAVVQHQATANKCQMEADAAQRRYRSQLDEMSRLHAQHGRTMDVTKPFFKASREASASLQLAHGIAREFSGAAAEHVRAKEELHAVEENLEVWSSRQMSLSRDQQETISRVTERLLRCQGERDVQEKRHIAALRKFSEAQAAAEAWRAKVGEAAVRAAEPFYRHLAQCQAQLAAEQARIAQLEEQAKSSRRAHRQTMEELERISEAVHKARCEAAGGEDPPEQLANNPPFKAGTEAVPEAAPEVTGMEIGPTEGQLLKPEFSFVEGAPETGGDLGVVIGCED